MRRTDKGPLWRLGIQKRGLDCSHRPPRATIPPDIDGSERHRQRDHLATFDGFSPSHRREYVEWILEAKRDETRRRRIETAVAWMAEGKSRNWKYARSN